MLNHQCESEIGIFLYFMYITILQVGIKRKERFNMRKEEKFVIYDIFKSPEVGWIAETRKFVRVYMGKIFF